MVSTRGNLRQWTAMRPGLGDREMIHMPSMEGRLYGQQARAYAPASNVLVTQRHFEHCFNSLQELQARFILQCLVKPILVSYPASSVGFGSNSDNFHSELILRSSSSSRT